jgi:hypothetical protein
VIILELEIARERTGDRVFFLGLPPYADGFELAMPLREWRMLGEPPLIQFVASSGELSVGRGMVHEDLRRRTDRHA